jgi:tRNA threonylcarbamoyladenosine biosynthesis protein TsaE
MTAARTIRTDSTEATERLGEDLARALVPGDAIGLVGDLGTGKTAFVRGLARGLGIPEGAVASPSFTMISEHRGRLPLYHVDLYRLEPGGADLLSLREYVYGDGVTAIEWFDRLPPGALDDYLLVRIDYAEPGRVLTIEGRGRRAAALVRAVAGDAQSR